MMEPNMIDFVELASSVENYILIVFVIVVNHVGFISFPFKLNSSLSGKFIIVIMKKL